MPAWFDVCGTPALGRIERILAEAGYRQVYGPLQAPGDFRVTPTDGAPGWSDWMYAVDLWELPEHPVAEILARERAESGHGR